MAAACRRLAESHRPLIARLCQAGEASAFSLTYRQAPDFAFPAGLRDGIDAYRHLLGRGIPASSIVLAGDGAGGGLAFACALAIRNAGLPAPAGIVAMSPWADLSLTGWSMLQNARTDAALSWDLLFVSARHYLKKSNPTDPYASPVYASFHDFPPIMVHAGSAEILRDDASRLGDRAAEAGIPVSVEIYDGMQHVFQASPYVPEARISLMRLGKFIKARTQNDARAAPARRLPRPAKSDGIANLCRGAQRLCGQSFGDHGRQFGAGDDGAAKLRVAQIGIGQIGIGQIGIEQPRASEIGAAEIGIARLDAVEPGRQQPASEISSGPSLASRRSALLSLAPAQIGAAQVGAAQPGAAQIGALKIASLQ